MFPKGNGEKHATEKKLQFLKWQRKNMMKHETATGVEKTAELNIVLQKLREWAAASDVKKLRVETWRLKKIETTAGLKNCELKASGVEKTADFNMHGWKTASCRCWKNCGFKQLQVCENHGCWTPLPPFAEPEEIVEPQKAQCAGSWAASGGGQRRWRWTWCRPTTSQATKVKGEGEGKVQSLNVKGCSFSFATGPCWHGHNSPTLTKYSFYTCDVMGLEIRYAKSLHGLWGWCLPAELRACTLSVCYLNHRACNAGVGKVNVDRSTTPTRIIQPNVSRYVLFVVLWMFLGLFCLLPSRVGAYLAIAPSKRGTRRMWMKICTCVRSW